MGIGVNDKIHILEKTAKDTVYRVRIDRPESSEIPVDMPTKTSELINDSGFITIEDVPGGGGGTTLNGISNDSNDNIVIDNNLYVSGHDSQIGKFETFRQPADITLDHQTRASVVSFSLPAGVWVLTGFLTFAAAATGRRWLGFTQTDVNTNIDYVQIMPASGGATRLNVSVQIQPSETTTYHLVGWQAQSTAATLVASGGVVKAVRIA